MAALGATDLGTMTSLEDLKMLPNLRVFCAAAEQITDISQLASLPGLIQVELRINDVTDISPLSGLYNLPYVGLNSNPVADISPLSGCPSLQVLDLCGVTGNYDGSVLTQLGDLEFLDISNRTDSYKYLGENQRELKISRHRWMTWRFSKM
jgi:internalin A